MNPNPDPAKHKEIPVWNAEDWFYEDIVIGKRLRSIRRTVSEGESMQFNALVLDMHPYVADEIFAKIEGVFGRRLVAGAMVFSVGLGLVATNCVNAFSYGYDKLRFIKPVFIGDTLYTIKTDLEKRPKYKDMGLYRASYEIFKNEGELVLYCEHLQTVKYRDPSKFADQVAEEMKPLEGLLVLDFSQFLAGPSAALRLADLGARVIKIERPGAGDLCRQLYISNLALDGDSTLFHSINRNKESFAADLKNPDDVALAKKLIERADVMIQNFRPGVMERIGLHHDVVKEINPRIVYGIVTGYGTQGPWVDKPGQDLLTQSLSGLAWLSGNADQGPVPMGLAIADMFASAHLVQGILACLVRRGVTGRGGLVEVSLMESILDYQFEVLTTHLNDGGKLPERSSINNAHAYLGAPYGIYKTADGYIAIAMGSVVRLGELLGCAPLITYADPKTWFTHRDEIKAHLAAHLKTMPTAHWLGILEAADVWCSDVFTWQKLLDHEGFKVLNMTQRVSRSNGASLTTTRCPIRVDGEILFSSAGAPKVGEHTQQIRELLNQ